MRRLTAIALLSLAAIAGGCGEEEKTADFGGGSAETAAPEAPAETTPAPPAPAGCEQAEQPEPKPDGGAKKPKGKLDASKKHTLVVQTNCGSFTIALDLKAAPKTSASLVSLAKSGFYKDTVFHRIVPDFVIQGGDPTGSGSGGPGYSTVDKPPRNAKYTKGVVAMAKSGQEPPGTAGSQFYVVTGADAGLPPEYAVVGKVTKGLDVVERIGKLGDPASGEAGTPTAVVVIQDVKARAS